jgi:hypothetical protein
MAELIVGLSCANCGLPVPTADRRQLGYATEVALEAPNQVGLTKGIASAVFSVSRQVDRNTRVDMLLCDGCMGAVVKAVCQSVLTDMETMNGEGETTGDGHAPKAH